MDLHSSRSRGGCAPGCFLLWRARHRIPVFFATLVLQHRRGRLCHIFVLGATAEVAGDGTPFQTRLSFQNQMGNGQSSVVKERSNAKRNVGAGIKGRRPLGVLRMLIT